MRIHGVQLLKSSDLGRHSLLYLKEIGHGWFGKVLLGEVNAGLSTTQVVVKELKASASVQDQMQFLEEVQPYRTLQHPALLQCLAQCSEVTPYLLVMEFCPLGDLKSYLHSCRVADSETPDPLILQRMACDIASGLVHLHKYNFIHSISDFVAGGEPLSHSHGHVVAAIATNQWKSSLFVESDLALRNCLLTSEMSVKIGDYGLSHSRYKDDYYITQDQIWVPLRWIAPELIDEVHGNLLVVDQTKSSNIWSLGVTTWELFELGNQPYRHYSDRQVLTYAVKEQQLKLPKPQLQSPLAERWYEVMQFCWLQPELRPSSEEVHLLVTYLCAKGSSEAEEDFEQRWNALRPNLLGSTSHTATSTALLLTPTPASADVPGEDQTQAVELASSASSSFPLLEHFSDSFHSDTGDDLLTVTETSHGLNFEYKWEQARSEQPYCSSSTSGPLGQGNPHYQDIYYSMLSAHSPSVSSEYYIRIEEPVECNINLDDSLVDYSPGLEASNSRLSSESHTCSSMAHPSAYWSTADNTKSTAYDSDSSPTVELTMEPLLRQASSTSPVKLSHSLNCFSSSQDDSVYCEQSSAYKTRHQSCLSEMDASPESRSNLIHPVGHLENPRSLSQAVSSPSLGFCDPYLEASTGRSTLNESCHNMMGPLRKTVPIVNHISIDVGTDDGLLVGQQRGEDTEDDLFSEGEATNWTSNHSANNNSLSFDSRQTGTGPNSYLDLQYTPHSNTTDLWSLTKATTKTFHSSRSCGTLEAGGDYNAASKPSELGSYINLCHKESEEAATEVERNFSIDTLSSSSINARGTEGGNMEGKHEKKLLLNGERLYSEPKMIPEATYIKSPSSFKEPQTGQSGALSVKHRGNIWEGVSAGISVGLGDKRLNYPDTSESSRVMDSGVGVRNSSIGLVELGDYSEDDDDDITDITSGIFADFNLDYAEVEEEELSPLKNPERTPDSVDTLNLSSSMASPCDQAFSPDPFNTPVLPKSLDSGYDTENNESPEFIFKELGDPRGGEMSPRLGGEPELVLQVGLGQGVCTSTSTSELQLKGLTEKNPYRDSAYFSDYDAENERSPQDEGSKFYAAPSNRDFPAEKLSSIRDDAPVKRQFNNEEHLTNLKHVKSCVLVNLSEANPSSPHPLPTPGLSMLSPFPPQMGGCLTKEPAPADDDLGLETEHSGEEPPSELSSSIGSEPSSTVQEASGNCEEGNRRAEDCSPVQSLHSDSTITDYGDEAPKENENGEGSTEEEELPEFNHVKEETEDRKEGVRINEEDFEDIDAEECDSQDSLCEESNGPADLSSSSSLLELCGEEVRAPLEEAEDEDDSDDSESDEELRTYNIQDEDSEESEEDFSTVPVVVSDCSRARHLRSLLKMPTLLTQSFCDELERKKKAVSFFDDVTVFLFDQESPTGELADYTFCTESSGQDSSEEKGSDPQVQRDTDPEAESCETVCVSEETDGNNSEEGGGYEWENEPFEPRPSSPDTIPEPQSSPTPTSNSPEAPKPAAVAINQFMVSRFSITHVSDSHMGPATGRPRSGSLAQRNPPPTNRYCPHRHRQQQHPGRTEGGKEGPGEEERTERRDETGLFHLEKGCVWRQEEERWR
ncbi:hypothetical protein L3Q82_002716 [Scortum barcoo]|uniref:Uncharacterized protein n=1 Tax=Scortum barcoo TaxID=214431 RepID=A0ACB8VUX9_9TELE|nr:hypothetical protein L3Q82_002716 [Scortum barcoo]